MAPDSEQRPECRDDFGRITNDIRDITKPGGTIATVHKKLDEQKACLQREIKEKVPSTIFRFVVGGLAMAAAGLFIYSFMYVHAVEQGTEDHVTEIEAAARIEEVKEYLTEKIENVEANVDEDITRMLIQNTKDKQEILDAIKNTR